MGLELNQIHLIFRSYIEVGATNDIGLMICGMLRVGFICQLSLSVRATCSKFFMSQVSIFVGLLYKLFFWVIKCLYDKER